MSILDDLDGNDPQKRVDAAQIVLANAKTRGGVTDFARLYGQRFARGLLESTVYREWLTERIAQHKLSVQMEIELWHYAYGKPQENVEMNVNVQREDLSTLSVEDLQQRVAKLADMLEDARALQSAIDVQAERVSA